MQELFGCTQIELTSNRKSLSRRLPELKGRPLFGRSVFLSGCLVNDVHWLGMRTKGLYYSDNGSYLKFPDGGLPGNYVTVITSDVDGTVAGGFQSRGVAQFDGTYWTSAGIVGTITNGLREGVRALAYDNDGNLWMGTNEGLVKYNPEKNEFRQFTIEDGIQSNEFDIHARFKDKNGLIYLGGIGGVTYFNPDDLEEIDLPQKLYFSSLHIKGKAVKIDKKSILKQRLSKTKNIEFKPDQFPFFLQFSSIDFRLNKNVKFGYKLLPTDKEWNLLKDPEIQFKDTGFISGDLTVYYNGCEGSTYVLDSFIYVNGPAGNVLISLDCDEPFKYSYYFDINGTTNRWPAAAQRSRLRRNKLDTDGYGVTGNLRTNRSQDNVCPGLTQT